ncbi:MAG: hypothetical protein ACYSTT_10580 [Planctomycetota bacterium]|jgi:hypothetical protein
MSEPVHIKEVLPAVMSDIGRRMKRHRNKQHRQRMVSVVRDFMGKRRPRAGRAPKKKGVFQVDE